MCRFYHTIIIYLHQLLHFVSLSVSGTTQKAADEFFGGGGCMTSIIRFWWWSGSWCRDQSFFTGIFTSAEQEQFTYFWWQVKNWWWIFMIFEGWDVNSNKIFDLGADPDPEIVTLQERAKSKNFAGSVVIVEVCSFQVLLPVIF